MCDEVFSPIPTLPSGRCPPHPNNLNEFAVQGVADLEPSYHTNTKTDTNTNLYHSCTVTNTQNQIQLQTCITVLALGLQECDMNAKVG